jgi:glycosyltransferase involved in cell wall biosynthesis
VVKRLAFAVPGDLRTPTGGYTYDRRMIAELQQLGWQVDLIGLGDGFPKPSAAQKAFAGEQLLAAPEGCPVLVDGLALGVLPEAAGEVRKRCPLVALVHHPLAYETGVSPEQAQALWESETAALAAAAHVIATSPATARLLQEEYDVPPELITIAPPGTDPAEPAAGSRDGTLRMISVGAIVPRKGFDILVAALAKLPDLPWHLTIVGDRSRDPPTAARLDADIAALGLRDRITVLDAQPADRLAELYAGADLFVLASHFEGFGMVFAEAIARGLPVVGTTGGAIPDTVPPNAGVLVEPGDVRALARTLELLIRNPDERRWLAQGARETAKTLPTWPDTARLFAAAIEAVG